MAGRYKASSASQASAWPNQTTQLARRRVCAAVWTSSGPGSSSFLLDLSDLLDLRDLLDLLLDPFLAAPSTPNPAEAKQHRYRQLG
jgi:hypothetical protein